MKKNFAMRIAACLLVVTMLSLCMVSYTYAKYTTADNGIDAARVAKWGVTVDVALEDLFDPAYDTADGTVIASGAYDLLAPGTKSESLNAIVIKGTPEVATEILPTVTVNLDGWMIGGEYYCPLVVKVNGVAVATATDADTYEANIKAAIEAAIKGQNADGKYAANAQLDHTVKVEWEWPFEGNDNLDTALGDQAAAGYAASFDITISVTINQVN